MSRVDAHAHVFRPAAISPRGTDALAPAERDAPLSTFIATLDRHGVDRAVLVPLDEHDDYVRECLEREPARFAAVAVSTAAERGLEGGDPVAALESRRSRFPFRALRTMWLGEPGRDIRDSPALPLLRWCAENGVVLWAYLPPDQFPLLDDVARELPDLTIGVNHFGFSPASMRVDEYARPWFAERLPDRRVDEVCALAVHPGVHVLVSGHYAVSREEPPYRDLVEPTTRYLHAFGADRLLWGSDMPWVEEEPGYGALLDAVDAALTSAGASAGERSLVTGGTAERLFGFA
jgi:predicted TIM-barrel fold metal-dependent hydrolase